MKSRFFVTPSTKKLILFLYIFFGFLAIQTYNGKKHFFDQKNLFFKKSDWTTNIFMLVNLEPIFGFILEINSIPNYLHGHTVVAMSFNMGHLVKTLRESRKAAPRMSHRLLRCQVVFTKICHYYYCYYYYCHFCHYYYCHSLIF